MKRRVRKVKRVGRRVEPDLQHPMTQELSFKLVQQAELLGLDLDEYAWMLLASLIGIPAPPTSGLSFDMTEYENYISDQLQNPLLAVWRPLWEDRNGEGAKFNIPGALLFLENAAETPAMAEKFPYFLHFTKEQEEKGTT